MMKDIEEIPADQLVEMTDLWYRAFVANGCKPCCHSCGKWIEVGDHFQLATVKSGHFVVAGQRWPHPEYQTQSTEVMIGSECDPIEFEKREYEAAQLYKQRKAAQGGGCYRVNGKIVV